MTQPDPQSTVSPATPPGGPDRLPSLSPLNPAGPNAFQLVWRNPYVRVPVFLLLMVLAWRFLHGLQHVLTLGVVAYIVAYLAHPLLAWLERRRIARSVGVLLVVVVALGFVALASGLLVTVVTQVSDLVQKLPLLTQNLLSWLDTLGERLPALKSVSAQVRSLSTNSAETLQTYVLPYLKRYEGNLLGGVFGVASGLAEGVATLILAVYMMLDYERIGQTLLRAFPEPWQPLAADLSRNVSVAVGGYLKGQLLIAAFVGVFVALGLTLFGIPSAPAIGFLAALFNIVPYLGVVISLVPALLLAATTSAALLKMLAVVGVFVAANQIEGHVLSPVVLGRSTDLHPATVILAILCGLTLYGILGALVAVPLTALAKLLLHEYYYPSRLYRRP